MARYQKVNLLGNVAELSDLTRYLNGSYGPVVSASQTIIQQPTIESGPPDQPIAGHPRDVEPGMFNLACAVLNTACQALSVRWNKTATWDTSIESFLTHTSIWHSAAGVDPSDFWPVVEKIRLHRLVVEDLSRDYERISRARRRRYEGSGNNVAGTTTCFD